MAIITDKIVIGRCMKCASQWLEAVMKEIEPTAEFHGQNAPLNQVDIPDRLNIFFVRHPLAWYASYWAYRERTGWAEGGNAVSGRELDAFKADNFDGFIENVLASYPYLSYLYDFHMAGRADRIGTVENIRYDLMKFLRESGTKFDEPVILGEPMVNTSNNLPIWNKGLADKILKFEKYVVSRWYR